MYPKTIPHWQILIITQKRYYFVHSPGNSVNYKAEVLSSLSNESPNCTQQVLSNYLLDNYKLK